MAYDDIFRIIGEFGCYHKLSYLWLFLLNVYMALPLMIVVFLFLDLPFRCQVPGLTNDTFHMQDDNHHQQVNASIPFDESTGVYSQCYVYTRESIESGGNETMACTSWVFHPDHAPSSWVSHLGLVCEHKYVKKQFTVMLAVGWGLAAIATGPIGDTFGRKKPMIIFELVSSVSLLVKTTTTNIPALLVVVCLCSALNMSSFLLSFTLIIEIVGPVKRPLAGLGIMFGWAMGLLLAVPYFYLIVDWRTEVYVMAAMGFCFVFYIWALDESPRWLLAQGRTNDVIAICNKMAKVNKVKLPEREELAAILFSGEEKKSEGRTLPFKKVMTVFQSRMLCTRILAMSFAWFSLNLIYVGVTFNIGDLIEGDVYVNFAILALMESLGYVVAYFLMRHFGRRTLLCAFLLLSGVSFLLNVIPALIPSKSIAWISVASFALGKLGITAALQLIYVFANELMPTVVRSSSVCICVFVGQVGGIVSPYLATLHTVVPSAFGKALPSLLFGATSVVAALLSLSLPETRNKQLPDTVEDAKTLSRPRDGREKNDTGGTLLVVSPQENGCV